MSVVSGRRKGRLTPGEATEQPYKKRMERTIWRGMVSAQKEKQGGLWVEGQSGKERVYL